MTTEKVVRKLRENFCRWRGSFRLAPALLRRIGLQCYVMPDVHLISTAIILMCSQVVAGLRFCIRFSARNVRCPSDSPGVCDESAPVSDASDLSIQSYDFFHINDSCMVTQQAYSCIRCRPREFKIIK